MTRDRLIQTISERLLALDLSRLQKVLTFVDRLYTAQYRQR